MNVMPEIALMPDIGTNSNSSLPPRQKYLFDTLGLTHDPFAHPVAEQELRSRKQPYFFDYLVFPPSPQKDKSLPEVLREAASHAIIWGAPGSGKTTLRYMLDEDCRALPNQTLTVTYELNDRFLQPPAPDAHWRALAEELAVDLFIQVTESLYTIGGKQEPTPVQKEHLTRQMALIRPRLQRVTDRMLNDDLSDKENDLAGFWPDLNRPPIRYIEATPKRLNLIRECLPTDTADTGGLTGQDLLTAGLEAAAVWGFKRILVLVDGVDAYHRTPQSMMALLDPLLKALPHRRSPNLSFYFFLTPELENPLTKTCRNIFKTLTTPPLSFKMEWGSQTLHTLLHHRLRVAGSRATGLNALAAQTIAPHLEESLITAANGSPRRLLQTVSALIDAHAQNNADARFFQPEDWALMRRQWPYFDFPLPPLLP